MSTTTGTPAAAAPKKGADFYIAKDPDDPRLCAVYRYLPRGPHELMAQGFENRKGAERWIEFQRAGGGHGG